MVYLDYNATTPLSPEARDAMLPFLDGDYGNPSSIHSAGRRARAAVDDSRDRLAAILGIRPHEIVFTGGGTESCNLALIGLARALRDKGRHIVVSAIEHHAVLHAAAHLRDEEGFEVEIVPVDAGGSVDPSRLEALLRTDTILVSVMHANNETGVLQPIGGIAEACGRHGVLLHTDAIQAFGKVELPRGLPGIAAMSLAAHKFYGPKGVGALFLRGGLPIARLAHGGSHENSRRPGTENVAAIAGMAAAAESASRLPPTETGRLEPLRELLWNRIASASSNAVRHGDPSRSLPNTLNVGFPGLDGEALLMGLDLEGICVSSGSACMVGSIQPSHVLTAMGVDPATALAAVRFSMGTGTTGDDITQAADALGRVLARQATPA